MSLGFSNRIIRNIECSGEREIERWNQSPLEVPTDVAGCCVLLVHQLYSDSCKPQSILSIIDSYTLIFARHENRLIFEQLQNTMEISCVYIKSSFQKKWIFVQYTVCNLCTTLHFTPSQKWCIFLHFKLIHLVIMTLKQSLWLNVKMLCSKSNTRFNNASENTACSAILERKSSYRKGLQPLLHVQYIDSLVNLGIH